MLGLGLQIQKLVNINAKKLSNWILSTGFWDDSKIWIDTETWRD